MDVSQDQMDEMSYEDLARLAQGGEESPPAPEMPPEEMAPASMEEAPAPEMAPADALEAPAPEALPVQPERQGNPEIPLQRTREELRQHQEALARYEAFLRDPQAMREYLSQLEPGEAPDFDDDPQAAVQSIIAPLKQEMESLKAELAQAKQEKATQAMLTELAGKHGNDFNHVLQAFDTDNPHLVQQGIHPEVRYMAALGLKAKSTPATDPGVIEAQAKALAEKMLAEHLASGKPMRGIPTLGGAPQAREERPAPDLDKLSQGEMDGMSLEQLRDLARRASGG